MNPHQLMKAMRAHMSKLENMQSELKSKYFTNSTEVALPQANSENLEQKNSVSVEIKMNGEGDKTEIALSCTHIKGENQDLDLKIKPSLEQAILETYNNVAGQVQDYASAIQSSVSAKTDKLMSQMMSLVNTSTKAKIAHMENKASQESQNEYTGSSGSGEIVVVLNGDNTMQSIKINENILKEDLDLIQDLISIAINNAKEQFPKAQQ